MHFSQTSDLESRCPDHRCGPETAADYDAASRTATISTIEFVDRARRQLLKNVTALT